MSCFGGKKQAVPVDPKEEARNEEINKELKEAKKAESSTGDAGKSTFAKQMKVIHKDGFNKAELGRFTDILRDNCLVAMQKELADQVQKLWKTKCIQAAFERNNELQLPGGSSGAEYYFAAADRFAAEDYLPTLDDIIRAKVRTTGITETNFTVTGIEFIMVDVGGQRSERRKWLHCFGDVTAVLFLVALNEYDMVLEEDNTTNRMEESIKLFQKLTGSQWFKETSFILFLNKSDLFKDKIVKKPLKDFFEDYEEVAATHGDKSEFDKSCEYVKKQYIDAFEGKALYPFITCAIDKDNCNKVFDAVRDTIISNSLDGQGIQ